MASALLFLIRDVRWGDPLAGGKHPAFFVAGLEQGAATDG
jgi:hypothetical protein